ncbi:PREDICTED: U6 snRNA-associated Sm-like protein LSm1 [Charadrius vociferus]|uniref:U6 snRNA-associated Sm-like protein LSm1 n=1 Tax=Charadrius vociferus TaxID=50402 RepID=UPI000521CF24|nr:PREDICTED: U6 snRNA-associated Sm-like protein LSm1 [Charadrius vociferus]
MGGRTPSFPVGAAPRGHQSRVGLLQEAPSLPFMLLQQLAAHHRLPPPTCVLGGKHLVLLRDGRTLIGYLRSIDQFANLVLHQTVERIHVGKKYGDIPRGIFVVRGENVVLLGEIDLEKESDTPLQQVSIEEILEEQRVEQQAKQESEKLKVQALKERGLSVPRADTLDEY